MSAFEPLPAKTSPRAAIARHWHSVVPVPKSATKPPDYHPKLGRPTATYRYYTVDGELVGFVQRFDTQDGKSFRPLTYGHWAGDETRRWSWRMWRPPRPIFGQELLSAKPGARVLVCEGEKAALAAREMLPNFVVVTSPGGANAAHHGDWLVLRDRDVVVWPDADQAGKRFAKDVVDCLRGLALTVKVLKVPDDKVSGWDAADALSEGWTPARVDELITRAEVPGDAIAPRGTAAAGAAAAKRGGKPGGDNAPGHKRPSKRDLLIDLVDPEWLWHTPEFEAYASVPVDGHLENHALRSQSFRRWLTWRYYRTHNAAPAAQTLEDALRLFDSMAIYDGPCREVWLRTAKQGERLYWDLCDAEWRAIEIRADGFDIVSDPPVKFIRNATMLPLPDPEGGNSISYLRGFVNVASEDDFLLLVAWLVAAIHPDGPYPILMLNGVQGSSKSTLSRILCQIADPRSAVLRSLPSDEQDLMVMAHNNRVLVLDNLSGISGATSDALCRIATGAAYGKRRLYADREESIISVRRPTLMNGISDVVGRPDLLDRSIVLSLPAISESGRRSERAFFEEFEAILPSIVGALCDGLSSVLRNKDSVKLETPPRMADFAQLIVAAASGLGFEAGQFLEAYDANSRTASADIIEEDDVAREILDYLTEVGEWQGGAAELLELLNARISEATRRGRTWPQNSRAMGARLRRLEPVLRKSGLRVAYARHGEARARVWSLSKQR